MSNHPSPKKIIILTAPSGSGKSTIKNYLLRHCHQLEFSISACTRPPRGAEKDGIDYYFISPEDFRQRIYEDAFIEYEMVYEGKYYGTLKSEMNRIWKKNRSPLIDIDVEGALNIKKNYPEQTLSLFIMPPSLDVLEERLLKRGTESSLGLKERLAKANSELKYADKFDKIVINDELEIAEKNALELVNEFLRQ